MAGTKDDRRRRISLTVNGKKLETEVGASLTLAEFLRENLDLTGTKVGCNRGECGSCTVLGDEAAVYSCTMLAADAAGKDVVTIEGLTPEIGLSVIQQAFIDQDALQCGYCTPGMIVSVEALLRKNPRPTADEVKRAIDGNLCRCGAYPNIIKAVMDASAKIAPGGKD